MRLTLRTLLAYLDEVLPAPQAEEIGKKLQESPMGNSLVRRIQDVLRQRRLSSPSVTGPGMGIDPNAVAEYLDGTLPADGIASVERICLESDLHLAEVASCHRMLAELHRDPTALEPFDEANGRAALAASQADITGPLIDPSTSRGTARPRPAAVVGNPRRSTSWLAWLSAAVAFLLLISLGGVLVMLTMGRGGRPPRITDAGCGWSPNRSSQTPSWRNRP